MIRSVCIHLMCMHTTCTPPVQHTAKDIRAAAPRHDTYGHGKYQSEQLTFLMPISVFTTRHECMAQMVVQVDLHDTCTQILLDNQCITPQSAVCRQFEGKTHNGPLMQKECTTCTLFLHLHSLVQYLCIHI